MNEIPVPKARECTELLITAKITHHLNSVLYFISSTKLQDLYKQNNNNNNNNREQQLQDLQVKKKKKKSTD